MTEQELNKITIRHLGDGQDEWGILEPEETLNEIMRLAKIGLKYEQSQDEE
jgi:hypothetical protein